MSILFYVISGLLFVLAFLWHRNYMKAPAGSERTISMEPVLVASALFAIAGTLA